MLVDLDLLDERHITIVAEAIAEGRIGYVVRSLHGIDDPDRVLYGECLPCLIERDGTEHFDSAFVPALEALGETSALDRHMVRLVLDELGSNSRAVLGCSLSSDNLSDLENWAHIRDQIAARCELASRLILKIDATPPFADITPATDLLSEVRAFGCRIAIDGFGREYASELYPWDIEVDIVKIDASLASDSHRPDDPNTLSLAVGLAKRAARVVVVEGIETIEQLEAARMAGATHVQGNHLAKPVFPLLAPNGRP